MGRLGKEWKKSKPKWIVSQLATYFKNDKLVQLGVDGGLSVFAQPLFNITLFLILFLSLFFILLYVFIVNNPESFM